MNSRQSSASAAEAEAEAEAEAVVKTFSWKFYIRKKSELRVEVERFVPIRVQLLFGTELPLRTWLSIPTYIFTWNGSMIELEGNNDVCVSYEMPMMKHWKFHENLDRRRVRAKVATNSCFDSSQGPRVIVIDPTDSGKSSVGKMLLSWACKKSWKPTFVDLDIGQRSATIPGCIAATPVEMPIDAVEGIPLEMSIVYFCGHTSPRFCTEDLSRNCLEPLKDSYQAMLNLELLAQLSTLWDGSRILGMSCFFMPLILSIQM